MSRREGLIAALILVLVFSIAAWPRLRYVDREGYDETQRWTPEEHPTLQQKTGAHP
jgi:hypothetical protein